MKKLNLKEKISKCEKIAISFTMHSLEATLCGYLVFMYQLYLISKLDGSAFFIGILTARETLEYLHCSFALSLLGGLFLNFAIKSEKKKR